MTARTKTSRNPFAYGQPITLDTLGELFAHHRSLTGGHSMSITPPEPTPPANPPAPAPTPPAPVTFEAITSQEEFDQRLGQRLAREREKYSDYDDLKAKAAQLDEITEANRSEQEKAVDAARKEGEAAGRQASDARVVKAEARAALAAANARNVDSAVKLLDLSGITLGADGEIDSAVLTARIDALKASDDYLFGTGTTPPPAPTPDPSQGGGGGGSEKPGSIAEARAKAREEREAKTTKTA